MPTPAALFGSILFGLLGLAALRYGRKQGLWKPMAGGVALMVFPYFVEQVWLLYLTGFSICAALFLFRD